MREVASRAGCDVALVNYYFGSKEGLLAAALEDALAELRQVLETYTRRRAPSRSRSAAWCGSRSWPWGSGATCPA